MKTVPQVIPNICTNHNIGSQSYFTIADGNQKDNFFKEHNSNGKSEMMNYQNNELKDSQDFNIAF